MAPEPAGVNAILHWAGHGGADKLREGAVNSVAGFLS